MSSIAIDGSREKSIRVGCVNAWMCACDDAAGASNLFLNRLQSQLRTKFNETFGIDDDLCIFSSDSFSNTSTITKIDRTVMVCGRLLTFRSTKAFNINALNDFTILPNIKFSVLYISYSEVHQFYLN